MATIVSFFGAEEIGAPVPSAADGGGIFNNGTNVSVFSYDTTNQRSGAACLKSTYGATQQSYAELSINDWTATNYTVVSFYFKFDANPGANCIIGQSTMASVFASIRLNTDGTLVVACSAGTGPTTSSSSAVLATGQWHRVDFLMDASNALVTAEIKVNGGAALTASTTAAAAGTGRIWRVGPLSSQAALNGHVLYYDDIVCSNVLADYPLGEYKILSYLPNADGAHAVGAGVFKRVTGNAADASGTTITNSTTDAWDVLDDWPVIADGDASDDWISKTSGVLSSEYVEVAFADPDASAPAPDAVRMVGAIRNDTGTATNQVSFRGAENGTEGGTGFGGTIGSATTIYKGKLYAKRMDGTSAWTRQALVDLRGRIKSTNVSVIPRVKALQIQAAFPITSQKLRPDGDLATTGWTTTPLFSKLNDESDSTIITSTAA